MIKKIVSVISVSFSRIALSSLFFLTLSSCLGQGTSQIHDIVNLKFDATAVCKTQMQTIPIQNTSNEEVVIEGVAISGGTDPLGNFSIESITIGSVETVSLDGTLSDIHIPAHQDYSLKISFSPKIPNRQQRAVVDIAYAQPAGIVQIALLGDASDFSPDCPPSTTGDQGSGDTSGGTGTTNGGGTGGTAGTPENYTLVVEKMVALPTQVAAPINTTQSRQGFTFHQPSLKIILDATSGTLTVPAFKNDDPNNPFVLPPPDQKLFIGQIINGSISVTIPSDTTGTYADATGAMDIKNMVINMNGSEDFIADLNIHLTTGKIKVSSVTKLFLTNGLKAFGSPSRYDTVTDMISGTAWNKSTGAVILVGIGNLSNIQYMPDISTTLQGGLSSNPYMAAIIEGTLTKN